MIKFYSANKDKWAELSNMRGSGFYVKDNGTMLFMQCVEKFYVYCKSIRSVDKELVLKCKNGFECKKIGKKIKLREDWEKIKVDVMRYALKKKFENERMKKLLLNSGNEKLVEDNPWDEFWGCGKNEEGLNMMGKLLMELRKEIRIQGE